ncbi:MAG: transaldolase family protein [Planctomycetes bacterium]|jgi:transaldolase|nr:transaldolase family protein [Planctomycetota bacterium]
MKQDYLRWAISKTRTTWWHDSADPAELKRGIERGAIGATTNPFLASLALHANRAAWAPEIQRVLAGKPAPEKKAEELTGIVVRHAAAQLLPQYQKTGGQTGYVCAQVNPSQAGDREPMLAMARRFHQLAPNIAVKLPGTAAGLDVLEECAAEGITCTLTISYTVPQTLATAERYRRGLQRAKANGIVPGKCFAVIMIGRLDDYLREVAHDGGFSVSEADLRQAGLAVTKRAYSLYRQRGYEAVLIIAALRGAHHMTELAGADVIMSIFPSIQELLLTPDLPQEERIDAQVPADVIARLAEIPDFVRAYEPDGMKPAEFITYGVTQRTLSQFIESGWKRMESFDL